MEKKQECNRANWHLNAFIFNCHCMKNCVSQSALTFSSQGTDQRVRFSFRALKHLFPRNSHQCNFLTGYALKKHYELQWRFFTFPSQQRKSS